jgi:hypothetical protein
VGFQVLTAASVNSTVLVTENVRTSETSVYFSETTRRYIPEGCNLSRRDVWTPAAVSTQQPLTAVEAKLQDA